MAKKDSKKQEKPAKPAKPQKPAKDKKAKGKKGEVPPTGTPSQPLSTTPPDQMSQQQLEQALRESNDPNTQLRKLRSPVNVRSCLLNILFLIVLTFGVVVLWCYLYVDKFDFVLLMSDMMDKFGIAKFFSNMGHTIAGWFGG